MDFLDPKKMRQHSIRLIIGYVLVATAVLLATTLLIMYAHGFRLSRDGRLNQNGLVFVSSQPTGGRVIIGGEDRAATNAKLNLAAGRYDVVIKRDGYVDWSRNILVEGGRVDHYVYPLLLPVELTSQSVQSFPRKPAFVSQTPDKRWMLLQESAGDRFVVYDLDRSPETVTDTTEFVIPASVVSASDTPATWEAIEWTGNNRHLLAIRSYMVDDKPRQEYILVDRSRPEGSHNLSTELSLPVGAVVSLRDNKADRYYVYNEQVERLYTASLSEKKLVVLLEAVLQFKSYGADILLYATDVDADKGQVRLIFRDGDQSYDIRQVAASDVYLLDLARYDGNWNIVAGSSRENRVYVYENPLDSMKTSRTGRPVTSFVFTMKDPSHVSFSANAQFIALQNGQSIHVYDIDNIRAYRYELPFPIDAPQTHAEWVDGYRLTYVSGGKQVLMEYDKNNRRELANSLVAYGGFFDRNNRYLYTFTRSDAKKPNTSLTVTPLRIPTDL